MPASFRKAVALALMAWMLVLGASSAAAFSTEVQHDLEWSHGAPADTSSVDPHGCAGHVSAHFVTLEQVGAEWMVASSADSFVRHPDAHALAWQPDPFSRPPDPLLA
jgi:hypothetical protein